MVLGSKKKISGCSLFPVHVRCYGWRHVNVSYQVPCQCPTSFSVSSSLPTVFATMNWTRKFNKTTKNKLYLSDRSRSLELAAVPSSSTGGADMPTHKITSGKADHIAGFPNVTLAEQVHQKTTQPALKKRWTKRQVSAAAIFSRRCSRVGKNPGLRRWPDTFPCI